MEKDDEKKKTTIPLKTVNTIIRGVLGDKVKVSKSFVKLVRQKLAVQVLDARMRECLHQSFSNGANPSGRK